MRSEIFQRGLDVEGGSPVVLVEPNGVEATGAAPNLVGAGAHEAKVGVGAPAVATAVTPN